MPAPEEHFSMFSGDAPEAPATERSTQAQIADVLADESAPIDWGGALGRKGFGALAKGVIGTLAGATPEQIAEAVVSGQISPTVAASLINQYAGPAIGRQGIVDAVRGAEEGYGLEGWDAVNAARQDPVSRDISIGQTGINIGPGPTSKQSLSSQQLDQSLVKNRSLSRPLTSIAWEGVKSMLGYGRSPFSSTYDAPEALASKGGFSFEAVEPEEIGISPEEDTVPGGINTTQPETDLRDTLAEAMVGGPKSKEQVDLLEDLFAKVENPGGGGTGSDKGPPDTGWGDAGLGGGAPAAAGPDSWGDAGLGGGLPAVRATMLHKGPDVSRGMAAIGDFRAASAAGDTKGMAQAAARAGGYGNIQAASRESSPQNDFPGGGPAAENDKYLCGELHRQGLMPDYIYQADLQYSQKVNPILKEGYAIWAKPFAKYLSKETKTGKFLAKAVRPFVVGWAQNMARRVNAKAKFSPLGAVVECIGVPVCYIMGNIKKVFDRSQIHAAETA